jgi:hypothetical protein
MKKFLILVVFSVSIGSAVFSLTESSMALGFGWEHFFETTSSDGQKAKTYLSAPGITYNAYSFWNKGNVGFFLNMAFLFPNRGTLDVNGVKTDVDLGVYDVLFQYNAMIGPGFRFGFNKNLTLQLGVGFNYMQTIGSYTKYVAYYSSKIGYTLLGFNLGIGGDVGIKYDITDGFFFCVGSTFSYDFACYTAVYSSFGNTSGWAGNYSMIGIRPYLCIGVNLWAEEPGLFKNKIGKPE